MTQAASTLKRRSPHDRKVLVRRFATQLRIVLTVTIACAFAEASSAVATPKTLTYGAPHPERQILYYPGKGPFVVYFHGGAWISGRKETFAFVGRTFSRLGFAVAIVDYRLSTSGSVRHPAHAEDGALAIRRLRDEMLPIVVVGHSAGAHLAATLVLDRSLGAASAIRGIVTTEGIFDVPRLASVFSSYVSWFLEPAFGPDRKRWHDASPRHRPLVGSPPWLLVHSRADTLVDTAQSTDMYDALRRAGVQATLELLEGLEHDDVTAKLGDERSSLVRTLAEFARRVAP